MEEPSAYLLWHGRPTAALTLCSDSSPACNDAPSCAAGPLARNRLHATLTTLSGILRSDVTLEVDGIHQEAVTRLGLANSGLYATPPGSVAAAAGIPSGTGGVMGAALVSFSSQCDCASAAQTPGSSSGGGAAPLNCLPAGDALVVFHASHSGFQITYVEWLGGASPFETHLELTSQVNGRRFVDVTRFGQQVAVTWLSRRPPPRMPDLQGVQRLRSLTACPWLRWVSLTAR